MAYTMKLSYSIYDDTIAFVDSDPDTIVDSLSRFIKGGFIDGQNITIVDSVANDGTYLVDTVAAGTITLDAGESLTAAAEGDLLTLGSVDFTFSPRIESGYAIPENRIRHQYEGVNGDLIINEISAKGKWIIPLNNVSKADYNKVYTWWDNMLKLTYTPDTAAPGTTYTVRITNDTDPLSMMFCVGWASIYEGTLILEQVPALS